MKIHISFGFRGKKSYLYLMKIQISFEIRIKSDLKMLISFKIRKKLDLKIQISFEIRKK